MAGLAAGARTHPDPRATDGSFWGKLAGSREEGVGSTGRFHKLSCSYGGYDFLAFDFFFDFCPSPTSLARNLAIRAINLIGIGSESGKRIVPLVSSYGASSSLNA